MRKIIFAVFLALIPFFLFTGTSFAVSDPITVPNNRFGIHILDESDLDDASNLVNSSGGSWGYVTFVIRQDERNTARWQAAFNRMRELHLIPIVRLATIQTGDNWKKPTVDDARDWVNFLNSLNWVTKNRYIILFNEPNHAKEWGGELDPRDYAHVAGAFADKLKQASPDYFVMNAALDLSAPNSFNTMEPAAFYWNMYSADPQIFELSDGLASHSYPNPNFSGDVSDFGKKSIRGFEWELSYLSGFGMKVSTPVFITETGWSHNIAPDKIADNYKKAFETVWNNPQIVTVTPFILKYTGVPFNFFSWLKSGSAYYPQYETVQGLKKETGKPEQLTTVNYIDVAIPQTLISQSEYDFNIRAKNTGQSIWNRDEFSLKVDGDLLTGSEVFADFVLTTKPFEEGNLGIRIKTPTTIGRFRIGFQLYRGAEPVGEHITRDFETIAPTTLSITTSLFLKRNTGGSDFSLILYDNDVRLIKKIDSILFKDGVAKLTDIRDIVPNHKYRFVLLKPYYLPSQTYAFFNKDNTRIAFNTLLPFDFNGDGKLSFSDIFAVLLHPIRTFKLLSPF